jgi:O-antigen ligase
MPKKSKLEYRGYLKGQSGGMMQSARWIDSSEYERLAVHVPRRISSLRFFLRYPIFLLAFGPPIFRAPIAASVANQAHFDIWSVFQVGWISLIALRAIPRLIFARSILIPKQIRSILRIAFFLGLVFLGSVAYSPGRIVSLEFSILYFLTLICVVEFIVDAYQNPPNWLQCIFQLRLVSLLLFAAVLLTLPFAPSLVMSIVPGVGIRLVGNAVGSTPVLCPIIAIISAYSFLHSLESRVRATVFFLVGLTGTLITQSRGTEIALFIVLAILCLGWAKKSRRSAYIFIFALAASILLAAVVVGSIGGGRIWNAFNRGQDFSGIATASGRTEIWKFAIQYSLTHPQGMGYVAGFRNIFTNHFDLNFEGDVKNLGTTHNTFVQYLVDGGWLGLVLFLIMSAKIFALGWRVTKKRPLVIMAPEFPTIHAIRCALFLLVFCLAEGMDISVFNIPLQGAFYYQNIIVAIILGASASMLILSRTRYASFPK